MINPRQVEAFRAVMLAGGVTPAAELMNVSQPAVSRLLRDLQQALGLRLFVRRGTRVVPTGEALSLYGEVERAFVGLARIEQAARDLRERRSGTLRIAALPALANGYLPRFVGRFIADRPGLDLTILGIPSHLVLDSVVTGQCDIGFAEVPIEHATIAIERLPPITAVAVVPAAHPLARKRRLGPHDFHHETFISLGPSTLLRYRIDAAFAERGVSRLLNIETPLSLIACALVSAGVGLSIVDPFTAREFASRGVAMRSFDPRIDFHLAIVHSMQRPLTGVARDFADAFRAELRSMAGVPAVTSAGHERSSR